MSIVALNLTHSTSRFPFIHTQGITGSVGNCLMTGLAIFSVVTQVIGLLVNAFSPPVYTPDIQLLVRLCVHVGVGYAVGCNTR